jgi:thiol:disulfide interchange protein DsbD
VTPSVEATPTSMPAPAVTPTQKPLGSVDPVVPPGDGDSGGGTSVTSLTDRASLWVQTSLSSRSWLLFPALFLAGLLMNLTPCVYPMIPITLNVLSQFGQHEGASEAERRRRRAILPFVYVAGMVVTYALMGVTAAMTGSIFGSLLQSPVVTVLLAVVMVLLGLSMLGVFNMTALQSFATRIPVAQKYPVAGVLTMGGVSGLVSAPCTGPVLSTILLLIGQSRDPVYGFVLMLFFSLGFGAPYVGLGLFTQKLARLPKAGSLLDGVKFVFAALMFALALYYLKPLVGRAEEVRWVFARPTAMALIVALLGGAVFHLYGRLQPQAARLTRLGSLAALTVMALWMTLWVTSGFVSLEPAVARAGSSVGMSGSTSAVAPGDAGGAGGAPVSEGVDWMKDWNQAVIRATVEKKPLIVDAWAEWCAACLKMDETVWKDPSVVETINERFVPVKLDFTRSSPFSEEIIERWELSGLPAVGFFPVGSDLTKAPPILFREAITASKFAETAAPLLAAQGSAAP